MNLKRLPTLIFISIFASILLIIFSQSVFAAECGPWPPYTRYSDKATCEQNCQTSCIDKGPAGTPWCCPKGCLGPLPCPPGSGLICIPNPLQACTFESLVESVINFIFYVALAVAPLMIVVAGIYMLFAGGDPGKVTTAKNIIIYTVVGLAIVFLAKGLIAVVKQVLGG